MYDVQSKDAEISAIKEIHNHMMNIRDDITGDAGTGFDAAEQDPPHFRAAPRHRAETLHHRETQLIDDFELAKMIEKVVHWQPGTEGGALEGTPADDMRFSYIKYDKPKN